MKNVLRTAVFAAAAVAATLTPASAEQMEVKIPFAFQAGAKALPAGSYVVQRMYGTVATTAYKLSDRHGVIQAVLMSGSHVYTDAAQPARLVFQCAQSGCRLTELWNGSAAGENFYYKPLPRDLEAKNVAIHFTSAGAE